MKKKNEGRKFEKRCVRYFRARGFKIIDITKATRDQGADIIAKKFFRTYAIQCKCYNHPVGNKAVQEAYAGKKYYGCNKAIAVTNTTFTKPAKQLAEKVNVKLIENVSFDRHCAFDTIMSIAVICLMIALLIKFAK